MTRNWGAVVVSALGGLAAAALGTFLLFAVGLRPTETGAGIAFILLQFSGQLIAGFLAGRVAGAPEILHGSLAALLAFTVAAAVALAGGSDLGLFSTLFGAIVSMVIGAAGGVLAAATRPEHRGGG